MALATGRRRAGLVVPLCASPSTRSWGIGDLGDLPFLTTWLASCGLRVLQLLPLNEMGPGQQSPYVAVSAMAIDPIFVCVPAVPDFVALGAEGALGERDRAALTRVRGSQRVEYAAVRRLKRRALRAAFRRFLDVEWRHDTARAQSLKAFMRDHAWWLEEYALFRAIHARTRERPWMKWARPLRQRKPAALDRARRELAREVLFWQYLQWIAGSQWEHARAEAHGIELFGDLPFMVDSDSADVWARQDEFRLDMSVGAPPDAFSATGQDWGVPLYRWDVIQSRGFEWLHQRARRCADLYDGYRIDHVVGFYRTYSRPRRGGEGFFTPANQGDQEILGEQVLGVMRATGSQIIAEDLGTVPEFVRASLARLDVPGFKVLRWEREWPEPGQPFRDPSDYPPLSVATSGTHDTEPLVVWWEGASEDDRQQVSALPTIQRLTGGAGILGSSGSRVRDVVLEALFASRSDLLLLPVQDVFGLRDRINDPATSSKLNWMFRLPWPCDRMDEIPEARERQATLRRWAAEYRRLG